MEEATAAAAAAVGADRRGDLALADTLYLHAVGLLLSAAERGVPDERARLRGVAEGYIKRVEEIRGQRGVGEPEPSPGGEGGQGAHGSGVEDDSSGSVCWWEQGNAAFKRAIEADERGDVSSAVPLYEDAAEHYLKYAGAGGRGGGGGGPEPSSVRGQVASILDRVASLKLAGEGGGDAPPGPGLPPPGAGAGPGRPLPAPAPPPSGRAAPPPKQQPAPPPLTAEERKVLQATSVINDRTFLPWVDDDQNEQFSFAAPFEDPDGLLPLAAKQQARFGAWRRPVELCKSWQAPVLIRELSAHSVVQTLVGDCSFVSSVAVAAEYERRFGRKILTKNIYPQNASGEPIYNPSGKYMMRLHVNGVPRRVVVDDRLPAGRQGELLCAHSAHPGEFWISILEKAFLKVAGGYDFPGSSSTSDLYALTGWLPESAHLDESGLDERRLWTRMRDGLMLGQCLMTMSTTNMDDETADRVGLVPTHAYAILDVREAAGVRLLQMKNPWSTVQWKGAYSAVDKARWTPALRAELPVGAMELSERDNGIFWIDWDSARGFFACVSMSWNPHLLGPHRGVAHAHWPAPAAGAAAVSGGLLGGGPKSDRFSLKNCPQYAVSVTNDTASPMTLWLLLLRHTTAHHMKNEEYITLHCYRPPGEAAGRRLYYPDDHQVHEGVYINSSHYLVKLPVPPGGRVSYVAVVTQYERKKGIYFTLRAHCLAPVALVELPPLYAFQEPPVLGEWPDSSLGVAAFLVAVNAETELCVQLEGPKEFGVNIRLYGPLGTPEGDAACVAPPADKSHVYRSGYAVLRVLRLRPGRYRLLASNYEKRGGKFFLHAGSSSCRIALQVDLAYVAQLAGR